MQIEFSLMQAYYLGFKYTEALRIFDNGILIDASADFPAMRELLIILYDCYEKTCQFDHADRVRCLIESQDAELSSDLKLSEALLKGDLCTISSIQSNCSRSDSLALFLCDYDSQAKSVRKAQYLNTILPGAGYYYVGQKKSALTSFIINTLFITAAYEFFHHGYPAAGIITTSLEFGWYFGGINGAGIEAKEYNEKLYGKLAKEYMFEEKLFPVLLFHYAF